MSVDPQALRAALGRFATGVTLVTCRAADGHPVGLTVNSFNALSLDPPLILWSLRAQSPSRAAFEAAGHFAVNVLACEQQALSQRFASPVPDKFSEGRWQDGAGGVPLLDGALAQFECRLDAVHDAGDHRLFIGRVLQVRQQAGEPLLYHAGRYRALAAAD